MKLIYYWRYIALGAVGIDQTLKSIKKPRNWRGFLVLSRMNFSNIR